jgi:hypothetical protein
MRFILPLIALAAAAPLAAETVTLRVAYGDVVVTSTEGRAALEGAGRYTFGRTVIDEKCVADVRIAALAEVERVAAAKAGAGRAVAAN